MKRKHKVFIWFFIIVIVLFGAYRITEYQLLRRIKNEITEVEKEKQHRINYKDLSINLFKRSLFISKLHISPSSHGALPLKLIASVDKLEINHLSLFDLIINDNINVSSLIIRNGKLLVDQRELAKKKESSKIDSKKKVNKLLCEKLQVESTMIFFKSNDKKFYTKNLNLTIQDIEIDSQNHNKVNFKNSEFEINAFVIKDSTGIISGANRIAFEEHRLSAKYLYSTPLKEAFAYMQEVKKDKIQKLSIRDLIILSPDILSQINSHAVKAGSITINGGYYHSFKNKNIPTDKIYKMPQEPLLKLKTAFDIDSLTINNFDIYYSEIAKGKSRPGQVTFRKTKIASGKITNNKTYLKDHKILDVKVNTLLMGTAELAGNFAFDMTDTNYSVNYHLALKKMNLQDLNPIIEPIANMRIKSGYLNKAETFVDADKRLATGSLSLNYVDLEISLVKEGNEKKTIRKVLSSVINKVFIPENKTVTENLPAKVTIYYIRNPKKSFLGYVWKSTLTGLLNSMDGQRLIQKQKLIDK